LLPSRDSSFQTGASNQALRTHRPRVGRRQAAEQAARCPTGERPPCPEWHLLGLAIWRTVARSAARFRPSYHLLQWLRSLASGWRVEPDRGPNSASQDDTPFRDKSPRPFQNLPRFCLADDACGPLIARRGCYGQPQRRMKPQPEAHEAATGSRSCNVQFPLETSGGACALAMIEGMSVPECLPAGRVCHHGRVRCASRRQR
jgi:hypothetical protein